jgi:hypothetical protein
MCGIVAYLGQREVLEILLRGLQRLEYRYGSVVMLGRNPLWPISGFSTRFPLCFASCLLVSHSSC